MICSAWWMTLFRELLISFQWFGDCRVSLDTVAPTDETPDKTTSHLTNSSKNDE
jgi:hypothetical protein